MLEIQIQPLLCGLEIALIGALLLTATTAAFAMISAKKGNQDGQGPASLDSFQISHAEEGSVIPWVAGRVRLSGNIIDFRNLQTEAIEAKSGGKGSESASSSDETTGYRYYLDVWQGICRGKVSLIKKYVQDKEETIQCTNEVFNNGENGLYPTWVTDASELPGIAHISWRKWYLGDNVASLPTVHFVVERVFPSTISNANLSNGSNPAATIYEILREAGVPATKINTTTFNAAANFWYSKGYGINLSFSNKGKTEESLQKVFGYVDGILYKDSDGNYSLRALNPSDSYVTQITEKEMEGLSLNRKTWHQVSNKFRATYIDESKNFSERTITCENPAGIRLAGMEIHASLDLTAFRDLQTASKRLFEIMKRESYPALEIKFKTSLKYSTLLPGDVIRINHAKYRIVAADFRVSKITSPEVNQNSIEISARQMVETLHDDVFVTAGGTEATDIDLRPVNLTKIKIFEIPYNGQTKFEPAFLVLASRECGFETGYDVLVSNEQTQNYENFGKFSTFSQQGTLTQEYPSATYQIDDSQTLRFTPYKNFDSFDTISRAQLFAVQRVAIIDDEMVCFEKVLPQGDGTIILQGIRRGVSGTNIQTHNQGASIFLTFLASNILRNIRFENFYVKLLPRFLGNVLDTASATATYITTSYKSRKPRDPGRLKAVRTGSDITVQIHPSTPGVRGAGDAFPQETDQIAPYPFDGDFNVNYGATNVIINQDSFSISYAGSVTITVKSRLNGYVSIGKSIVVGASDGTYYS